MNEVIRCLTERRSCRDFSEKQVEEEALQQILLAGTYAASGMGKQPAKIIVLQNKEDIDALETLNASIMGREGTHPFYGAPTVCIVLTKADAFTFDKFYVDIGAKDKKEAQRRVKIGDYFVIEPSVTRLCGKRIAGRPMDDRIGCAIMVETARRVTAPRDDVYYVFTAQEEVGTRGAFGAAFSVTPEIALVLETTTAADLPDSENPVCRLGGGAVISYMDGRTVYDEALYRLAVELCEARGIPWQTKTKIAGGNDAGAIQNSGARVLAVSVPCRYLHSPLCVMQESDADACNALLHALLEHLAENGAPAL